jgi:hypothetical protein
VRSVIQVLNQRVKVVMSVFAMNLFRCATAADR